MLQVNRIGPAGGVFRLHGVKNQQNDRKINQKLSITGAKQKNTLTRTDQNQESIHTSTIEQGNNTLELKNAAMRYATEKAKQNQKAAGDEIPDRRQSRQPAETPTINFLDAAGTHPKNKSYLKHNTLATESANSTKLNLSLVEINKTQKHKNQHTNDRSIAKHPIRYDRVIREREDSISVGRSRGTWVN